MKYNDEIAAKIIELHKFQPSKKAVWKIRDSIPNKFFDKEGKILDPSVLKLATLQQTKTMCDILKLSEISTDALVSITSNRAQDVIREKAKVTALEFAEFKIEVVQLRNILKSITTPTNGSQIERAAKEAIKDRRLKWYVISTHRRTIDNLKNNWEIDVPDLEQFRLDCSILSQTLII